MSRLIEADALFINLDGMMAVSPTGYIHGETVADMISDAPTVEAIPVEYIESTMNRWKEIIGYEESVEALRILIDNWKIERTEE